MKFRIGWTVACLIVLLVFTLNAAVEFGLAQNYKGDVGIKDDADVILYEDFESRSVNTIRSNWTYVTGTDRIFFVNDKPAGSTGSSSIQVDGLSTVMNGAVQLFKQFNTEYRELYFRYYVKFDLTTCQLIHHGSWIGGYKQHAGAWWGYACNPTVPLNAFSAGLEPMDFSRWDIYAYSANMRPDNTNLYCGNLYGVNQNTILATHRGQWECIETMIKMNTHPDSTDGEVAGWINGEKVLHLGKGFPMGRWAVGGLWTNSCRSASCIPFPGFQWSKDSSFAINWAFLQHYVGASPGGPDDLDCKGTYDHVVVAKKYIGPIPGSVGLLPAQGPKPTAGAPSVGFRWKGNRVQFDFQNQNNAFRLDLFSIEGKRLWSQSLPAGTKQVEWNTQNHSHGILFARIRSSGNTECFKLARGL